MALLTCWPSLGGVPLNTPFPAIGGAIILTELGQFNASSIVAPAANARAIRAMRPYTIIEVEQAGVGTIFSGYVLNPQQAISENDDHTLTIALTPLTVECTWEGTHRGWVAENYLSTVAARLGSLTPGWAGSFTDIYTPADILVSVALGDESALAGFLDTAKQFAQFARQGVDAAGAPTRVLEMGQFGAAPTVWFSGANGADAGGQRNGLARSPAVRLVATVDRQPNDVSSLVNVTTPFGGGGSAETVVTLERLWRLMNDATYPGAGLWGGVPGSRFPEYDPAYPIDDPRNRATGAPTFVDGVLADKGAYGSRHATLDGHWDYMVYDRDSYFGTAASPAYGHKWGPFVDSSLTYADGSVANQELTARALYVSTIANFKRFAHPHHTFTCTTPGLGRPTRAGDLVAVDYQRASAGDDGAVEEMNVAENLRVMSVTRSFQGDAAPVDTYILSNLGRFDETDASGQAETARTLVALQINRGAGLAKDSVVIRDNIDAANPITHWLYVPTEHFRYHQVRVRCDFLPFRGTATTATNIAGTPVISADVEVSLKTPADLNATAANIGGMPLHGHQFPLVALGAQAPTAASHWVGVVGSGDTEFTAAGVASGTRVQTGTQVAPTDFTPSSHTHPVAAAGTTVAHITAGQRIATLPAHVHDVEKRIPTGQPSPASVTMAVNGLALSSGAAATGTRDGSGAFTSSFVVDDIGPYLDAYAPGTDVPITFGAGTSAGNPFGVGYLVITITEVEELGGSVNTVRAA